MSSHQFAIKTIAEELIEKHLPNKGWTFKFDRAKRRMGACHYKFKKITLSTILSYVASDDQIRNTILHEIAHAMVGCDQHHNRIWRRAATLIGCDGKRCHNVDVGVGAKYSAWDSVCAKYYYLFRRPKYGLSGYKCGKCKVSLNFNTIRRVK